MSLVPSLLRAIVTIDGDALVLHVGDKPYVLSSSGQIDLAPRGLTLRRHRRRHRATPSGRIARGASGVRRHSARAYRSGPDSQASSSTSSRLAAATMCGWKFGGVVCPIPATGSTTPSKRIRESK